MMTENFIQKQRFIFQLVQGFKRRNTTKIRKGGRVGDETNYQLFQNHSQTSKQRKRRSRRSYFDVYLHFNKLGENRPVLWQKQTKLIQINGNIQNIINDLKNGKRNST